MSELLERVMLDLREELKRYSALTQASLKELRAMFEKSITDITAITTEFKKTVEALKKKGTVVEDSILKNYELRDTAWHKTGFSAIGDYDIYAFQVQNELDQPVTCQIMGNRLPTTVGAAVLGDPFTVSAGGIEIRTLSVYIGKWAPYAYVRFKAESAPTKGLIHITAFKRVG